MRAAQTCDNAQVVWEVLLWAIGEDRVGVMGWSGLFGQRQRLVLALFRSEAGQWRAFWRRQINKPARGVIIHSTN
jgi:hypothetical protein